MVRSNAALYPDIMEEGSIGRLSHFTEEEIAGIYAFLRDESGAKQLGAISGRLTPAPA